MKPSKYLWIENSSHQRLATKLADDITVKINQAIKTKGQAVIAFSGGSTPALLFEELISRDIDWAKVVITLVDERCVDEKNILSNAKFINTKLLSKLSNQPTFIPLFHSELDDIDDVFYKVIASYCEATNCDIENLAPFDVVILGMGFDGHTASFFPDADNIEFLVDPDTKEYLFSSKSDSTQVTRITWSLRMLLNTNFLALHFTGEKKKKVFKRAINNGEHAELPVRTAIFQDVSRLNVYYAD